MTFPGPQVLFIFAVCCPCHVEDVFPCGTRWLQPFRMTQWHLVKKRAFSNPACLILLARKLPRRPHVDISQLPLAKAGPCATSSSVTGEGREAPLGCTYPASSTYCGWAVCVHAWVCICVHLLPKQVERRSPKQNQASASKEDRCVGTGRTWRKKMILRDTMH